MSPVISRHAASAPQRAAIVWVLMLALCVASTLGLVHRTLHGMGAGAAQEASVASAGDAARSTANAAVAKPSGTSVLAALFGQHSAGNADCRLYDQLAHGAAAPCVPLVVLPMVLPQATFDYFLGEVLARWVALFDARGPPLSR